ncbi:myotubularin-related protein 9 [Diabrotica virgifera virgifera]|uniref:Myotubularin phosphatase domain-containing protein n=2 Tax=Diabrotica virgifera virgifera TaxID=50390 RepID=A0ABM5JY91_DIAVI|nr:myotubularin-related protein 9 [Diabrotica virgifera virgifera]
MDFIEMIKTPKLDGVILHSPFQDPVDGRICITGHHLIVSSMKEDVQELWLLHQCIDAVEKKVSSNNNAQSGGSILLKCKDFRILQLDIAHPEHFQNVYLSIHRLSNLEKPELLYPFFYRPMYTILEDGYTLFDLEVEFTKLIASDEWRVSNVNKNFSVCSTYGSTLVVPKAIDDETIVASAHFRDGGRFPCLSYRHENGTVLLRSSQPMLNNANRRCKADEKILNSVLGPYKKGYIIDMRSATYINYCKSKGGGTEPGGYYNQWKKVFKPLDKISKCDGSVLDHLAKFIEACNDPSSTSDKWISRSSNWMGHIQNTLNAACLVAQCLDKDGASVLVHGSNGQDSTLIVSSIAQVILNPDCRTVRGLQALIEREWIQAGHPFQTRHQKFCFTSSRSKGIQPTFLIFLDCIHQLHYQFPSSFEFKTDMLFLLFEHSYFSQFGTFLGNSELERSTIELSKNTTSLWSYLNRPDVLTSLLNPTYEPNKAPIWPSVAPVSIIVWADLYFRWIIDQQHQKITSTKVQNIIQRSKDLRSTAIKLRKQLLDKVKEFKCMQEELKEEEDDDD